MRPLKMQTTSLIQNLTIPKETQDRIIYKALLTRRVEETLLELYGKGELYGTVHTCLGQEFTGAIINEFLRPGDSIFSNHRCHGHFLSFTEDVVGLIGEIYGNSLGVCGGKGGSQHLCKNGFYSNGIQGGIIPVAAGLAWAKKLKDNENISIVFIGDGTLGEGVLYETLNIVSKWNLPLIIIVENNLYSQSTSQNEVLAGSICDRASAFSIRTEISSIWDIDHFFRSAEQLIDYTRTTSKPSFFRIDSYRLGPHSKGDDHRQFKEMEHYKSIDPLNLIINSDKNIPIFEEEISEKISQAVQKIKQSQNAESTFFSLTPLKWENPFSLTTNNSLRFGQAINETFKDLMLENEKIYFIGEDVRSPYGGAFKISQELSSKFPGRVLNTPISEAAIVGIGNGLALEGYRPIIEIMFGDFITLALDQIINHAAKFRYMYNEQVRVPIIIRTPMGGGRGYGPTHSQTLDRHLLGIPGIRVVALNNLIHPKSVYESLLNSSEDPTVVLENKVLYTKYLRTTAPEGFRSCFVNEKNYPAVIIEPETHYVDITLITYGGLSELAFEILSELFSEHEIIAQLICPIQIYPFEISPYLDLINKSRAVFLIEEGQGFANFSSELISQFSQLNLGKSPKFHRISADPSPIPSSKSLENLVLISKEKVINSIIQNL